VRTERDFAERLIDTAEVIVLVVDSEGRIVRYNAYMETLSDAGSTRSWAPIGWRRSSRRGTKPPPCAVAAR
jgi:hypothetical protein